MGMALVEGDNSGCGDASSSDGQGHKFYQLEGLSFEFKRK